MGSSQRKILYIAIAAFCIFAVIAGVVDQVSIAKAKNKESKEMAELGGISQAELKQEFNSIFDNEIHYNNYDLTGVSKKAENENIVYSAYDIVENKENTYEVDIHLPLVNINDDVATEFNKITQQVFADKATEILNKAEGSTTIYSVNYTGYIYGDVLSIILKSTLKEENNAQRTIVKTYNYDLKTKSEVSINDAISKKGINKSDVESKIKKQVVKAIQEANSINASGYNTYSRNIEDTIYNLDNISEFFFKEDGTLYIVFAYGNNNYTSEMDIIKI